MKRIFLLLGVSLIALSAFSQTVLRESTHGVLPGYPNPMILTTADNAGEAGKNVVWDFSGISQMGPFVGDVAEPSTLQPEIEFMNANTCLIEGYLQAFMKSDRKKLQVLGVRIPESRMVRVYDDPIVKMKYPFRYGDKYSSETRGKEIYSGNYSFDFKLSNMIEADGIGTLILPGTTLKNALRVLTTQIIVYDTPSYRGVSTIKTYRWYVNSHRYPVLSLIFEESIDGSLRCLKGAYNPVVEPEALLAQDDHSGKEPVKDGVLSLSVRPNPFTTDLRVSYTISNRASVIVALYNLSGQFVKTLYQGVLEAGQYEQDFSSRIQGLSAGQYILRVESAGKTLSQNLIKM